MRILHVVPSYIPAYRYGGPIYSVHGLCKGLLSLGHEIHVVTTNVDGANDTDVRLDKPVEIDGVKVWYYPSEHLRRLYWSPAMGQAFRKMMPGVDLIHLHSIFLWPTWMAGRIARKNGTPYIVSPRGMLVKELVHRKNRWIKTAWLNLIERKNLESAAGIHFTSQLEEEEAKFFGFNLPQTFSIPNGVDLVNEGYEIRALSPVARNIINNKPYILFLGRVNWKKGLDRLIEALRYLPNLPLVIAGNDEENYQPTLERLAEDKGVANRVHFIGPVYGDDKTALFAEATVMVLPSYSENFGNVVLEAMAVGCPVVVTPEVGAAEIVRESGAGKVVRGEPETLGKEIAQISKNPELLSRMGSQGILAVKEKYSWQRVAQQMGKSYQQIIE